MIDVNVFMSRWPFRRLALDEPAGLVAGLRQHGITQAWVGSFDGIFHKDLASANVRFAHDCRNHGADLLIPIGSINPKLPDWHEDLRRCYEELRMPGIRLHPNYHGYRLDDPAFSEVLRLAASHGFVVQLAVAMEDERTQHPLMRVPPVDLSPLPDILKNASGARLVLLNIDPIQNAERLKELFSFDNVYFDLSMIEGVNGVARLAKAVSSQRILFGSNCPLFYLESALLKVREADCTDAEKRAILAGNARGLLAVP
jgi:hypothetical protein